MAFYQSDMHFVASTNYFIETNYYSSLFSPLQYSFLTHYIFLLLLSPPSSLKAQGFYGCGGCGIHNEEGSFESSVMVFRMERRQNPGS